METTLKFKTKELLFDFEDQILEISVEIPSESPRASNFNYDTLVVTIERFGKKIEELVNEYVSDDKCKKL